MVLRVMADVIGSKQQMMEKLWSDLDHAESLLLSAHFTQAASLSLAIMQRASATGGSRESSGGEDGREEGGDSQVMTQLRLIREEGNDDRRGGRGGEGDGSEQQGGEQCEGGGCLQGEVATGGCLQGEVATGGCLQGEVATGGCLQGEVATGDGSGGMGFARRDGREGGGEDMGMEQEGTRSVGAEAEDDDERGLLLDAAGVVLVQSLDSLNRLDEMLSILKLLFPPTAPWPPPTLVIIICATLLIRSRSFHDAHALFIWFFRSLPLYPTPSSISYPCYSPHCPPPSPPSSLPLLQESKSGSRDGSMMSEGVSGEGSNRTQQRLAAAVQLHAVKVMGKGLGQWQQAAEWVCKLREDKIISSSSEKAFLLSIAAAHDESNSLMEAEGLKRSGEQTTGWKHQGQGAGAKEAVTDRCGITEIEDERSAVNVVRGKDEAQQQSGSRAISEDNMGNAVAAAKSSHVRPQAKLSLWSQWLESSAGLHGSKFTEGLVSVMASLRNVYGGSMPWTLLAFALALTAYKGRRHAERFLKCLRRMLSRAVVDIWRMAFNVHLNPLAIPQRQSY